MTGVQTCALPIFAEVGYTFGNTRLLAKYWPPATEPAEQAVVDTSEFPLDLGYFCETAVFLVYFSAKSIPALLSLARMMENKWHTALLLSLPIFTKEDLPLPLSHETRLQRGQPLPFEWGVVVSGEIGVSYHDHRKRILTRGGTFWVGDSPSERASARVVSRYCTMLVLDPQKRNSELPKALPLTRNRDGSKRPTPSNSHSPKKELVKDIETSSKINPSTQRQGPRKPDHLRFERSEDSQQKFLHSDELLDFSVFEYSVIDNERSNSKSGAEPSKYLSKLGEQGRRRVLETGIPQSVISTNKSSDKSYHLRKQAHSSKLAISRGVSGAKGSDKHVKLLLSGSRQTTDVVNHLGYHSLGQRETQPEHSEDSSIRVFQSSKVR